MYMVNVQVLGMYLTEAANTGPFELLVCSNMKGEPSLVLLCAWILEGRLWAKGEPFQLESFPHLQFY